MAKKDENGGLRVGSLDDILAADDTQADGVPVDVPEWGLRVLVKGLTRGEALAFSDIESGPEAEAFLLAHTLVQPQLTVEQAADLIAKKGHGPVRRVVQEALRVSGMTATFREATPD